MLLIYQQIKYYNIPSILEMESDLNKFNRKLIKKIEMLYYKSIKYVHLINSIKLVKNLL